MATPSRDSSGPKSKNAYATLLTRPSYLAGAILLAYTLHKHSPSTPLIILYTPETLPEPSVQALEAEAEHSNIILHPVEHLRLPPQEKTDGDGGGKEGGTGMVAERFIDTWTKLRVFELDDLAKERGWEKLCFLDADMMVFSDPSPLVFAESLGLKEGEVMATHICVCNLDRDAWAPEDWRPENCAHTSTTTSSTALTGPEVNSAPQGWAHMNTGAFVLRPTSSIRETVLGTFKNTPVKQLRSMQFPDQDFLNLVFRSSWRSLSWRVNALKTWRYWHPNFWKDGEVAVLHYIVDKPWAARVETNEQGRKVAGYKGEDGETHSWWWASYFQWKSLRESQSAAEREEVQEVEKYVASIDGKDDEALGAIGGKAQDYAKKWEAPKKMLGERGHGPVRSGRFAGGRGMGFMADG